MRGGVHLRNARAGMSMKRANLRAARWRPRRRRGPGREARLDADGDLGFASRDSASVPAGNQSYLACAVTSSACIAVGIATWRIALPVKSSLRRSSLRSPRFPYVRK